jgi:hypothetical protein
VLNRVAAPAKAPRIHVLAIAFATTNAHPVACVVIAAMM